MAVSSPSFSRISVNVNDSFQEKQTFRILLSKSGLNSYSRSHLVDFSAADVVCVGAEPDFSRRLEVVHMPD